MELLLYCKVHHRCYLGVLRVLFGCIFVSSVPRATVKT